MQEKSLKKIDARIQRVKDQLLALGPMRPGTLTRQYHKPQERQGAFWQISYTHQMKSRSEYARPDEVGCWWRRPRWGANGGGRLSEGCSAAPISFCAATRPRS